MSAGGSQRSLASIQKWAKRLLLLLLAATESSLDFRIARIGIWHELQGLAELIDGQVELSLTGERIPQHEVRLNQAGSAFQRFVEMADRFVEFSLLCHQVSKIQMEARKMRLNVRALQSPFIMAGGFIEASLIG